VKITSAMLERGLATFTRKHADAIERLEAALKMVAPEAGGAMRVESLVGELLLRMAHEYEGGLTKAVADLEEAVARLRADHDAAARGLPTRPEAARAADWTLVSRAEEIHLRFLQEVQDALDDPAVAADLKARVQEKINAPAPVPAPVAPPRTPRPGQAQAPAPAQPPPPPSAFLGPRRAKSGPPAPAQVDEQRTRVGELRALIARMEARKRERGRLSVDEENNLETLKTKLVAQYAVVPAGARRPQEAILLDRRPGESPDDYHKRLQAMRGEVEDIVLEKTQNWPLHEAYERQIRRTEADRDELKKLRSMLADVQEREKINSHQWKDNQSAHSRSDASSRSALILDRFRIEQEADALRAQNAKLRALIHGIEQRGSLFYGDQVWKSVPLVDHTDPIFESRVGLVGELDAVATLIEHGGFETLGKTVDPRQVTSVDEFEAVLSRYVGRRGIDFTLKRERSGTVEYLLGDAKASADLSSEARRTPTGSGLLKMMSSNQDVQLDLAWLRGRLPGVQLLARDLDNISKALAEAVTSPGRPVAVVHADGTTDQVIVRRVYAQVFRERDGTTRTRLYHVVGEPVTIGGPFVP